MDILPYLIKAGIPFSCFSGKTDFNKASEIHLRFTSEGEKKIYKHTLETVLKDQEIYLETITAKTLLYASIESWESQEEYIRRHKAINLILQK